MTGSTGRLVQRLRPSLLASLLALPFGAASADDTEVFFGSSGNGGGVRANVLFVLDTSGSMGGQRIEDMRQAVKDMIASDLKVNIGLMRYSGVYGGGAVIYPVSHPDHPLGQGPDADGSDPGGGDTSANGDGDGGDAGGDAGGTVALTYVTGANWNDVQQNDDDGSISGTESTMELGKDGASPQSTGLRFDGLAIPPGSTVLSAKLVFTAGASHSAATTYQVHTEDHLDAPVFEAADGHLSDRALNDSPVAWPVSAWTTGQTYDSPDLTAIVAQVVDRADWCEGNAIAFRLSQGNERSARSHEGGGEARAPRLELSVDTSTAGTAGCLLEQTIARTVEDSDDDAEQYLDDGRVLHDGQQLGMPADDGREQLVGIRFDRLSIPAGATITAAHIDLELRNADGQGRADMLIRSEASDDAQRYENSTDNISARQSNPATVAWTDLPVGQSDSTLSTPDLAELVQAVVGRSGWVSDSAVAFTFERLAGSGRRNFKSRNASAADGPRLSVSFTVPGVRRAERRSGGASTGTGAPTARQQMLMLIDELDAEGATPTVDSYYEAALYLRGEPVDYGLERGSITSQSRKRSYRVSHPGSYTGGSVVRDDGCTDADLFDANCASERIVGKPVYRSPMNDSCQANHIVLLSDGVTDRNRVKPKMMGLAGLASCDGISTIPDVDSKNPGSPEYTAEKREWQDHHEACATEFAAWLLNTDHQPLLSDRQTIRTHTIAYNIGGSAQAWLQRIATAGGGKSYAAQDAGDLSAVFEEIVEGVADSSSSFTAAGTSINQLNRLTHRDDIYFSVFKPSAQPRWYGNLKRYRLGKRPDGTGEVRVRGFDGEPAVDPDSGFFDPESISYWPERDELAQPIKDGDDVRRGGAANRLSLSGPGGATERRVFTWVGDAHDVPIIGVDLTSADQSLHESNARVSAAVLDIVGKGGSGAEQRATYRTRLLQWARGVDVNDADGDNDTTDVRATLGDPLHSRPIVVNYKDDTQPDGVRSIAYLGTNDGFVHAIDTRTGEEQFAFVPGELLQNLDRLYDNPLGGDRVYGVDGPLSTLRNDTDGDALIDASAGDSALLFAGLRRGGRGYYALDVSDPDTPRLQWALSEHSTGFSQLGQSWSQLAPVSMQIDGVTEQVLVLGGGYDPNQDRVPGASRSQSIDAQGNAIYIVRASSGHLLWSTDSVDFPEMKYGIPGNVRTIDINRDGLVDQMYAADTGGQVWRFDITPYHTDQDPGLVGGGVIASLADPNDADGSDHRRFYAEPDVALLDESGERVLTVGIGSGWRAHPLDTVTEDRFYLLRQPSVMRAPDGYGVAVDTERTMFRPVVESDLIPVQGKLNPPTNAHGWYLDFAGSGEKVTGTSVTFDNSVIFSTYLPGQLSAEPCSPSVGGGRAYLLDLRSGAPRRDLDDDGDVDLADASVELAHSGIPPEALVLISEQDPQSPVVLFGGEQLTSGISNATERTFWSDQGEAGRFVVAGADGDGGDGGDPGGDGGSGDTGAPSGVP